MTETQAQIARAAHRISARWRMTTLEALEAMLAVCEHVRDERATLAVEVICKAQNITREKLGAHVNAAIQSALEDRAESVAQNMTHEAFTNPDAG